MFGKLYTIARNTFVETIRQPIYGVILLLVALAMVMNVSLAGWTLSDDNKLLTSLGLSTLLVSGLFLAGFSAAGVLSREIDNRTVLTVVSKPVGRTVFVVGKFVGLAAALGIGFYLSAIMFLMSLRHKVMQTARDEFDLPVIIFGLTALTLVFLVGGVCNYLYRIEFTSMAVYLAVPLFTVAMILVCLISPKWEIQPITTDFGDGQVLVATVLIFWAVLMLGAVAVAASTRLGQVMTLLVCAGFLFVGLVSDYMLGRFRETSQLADLLYRITPNLQFFWIADALSQGQYVSPSYIVVAGSYAGCFIVAALLVAMALFQTRELG